MEPDEFAKLLDAKVAEANAALKAFAPTPTNVPTAEWFATHHMQPHTVIVTRETPNGPNDYASYGVEVWKDGDRIVAQCGDSKGGCIPGPLAWDNPTVFDARVHGLVDKVVDGFIANNQLQAWQEEEASKKNYTVVKENRHTHTFLAQV